MMWCELTTQCATAAECICQTFGKNVAWFNVSMIVSTMVLSAIGIIYAIAHALDIKNLKQMAKAELLQASASLLLVLLLFGIIGIEDSLIALAEKQTGLLTASLDPQKLVGMSPEQFKKAVYEEGKIITVSPINVASAFLFKLIDCTKNKYIDTYKLSKSPEFWANLQLGLTIGAVVEEIAFPAEWAWFVPTIAKQVQSLEYLAEELTWTSILLYMQLNLLRFIETSAFTLFLPIGIILRAFPPSRGAGAVLIAISIGLYIVFPFVYTILYVGAPPSFSGCNIEVGPEIAEEPLAGCPLGASAVAASQAKAAATSALGAGNIPKIQTTLNQITYVSFLYMMVAFGATFIFVRSVSGILGADISEIGRSMFKML